jgi:DNA-binding MarR family transcriptional regulator
MPPGPFEQEFPGLSESANAALVDIVRTSEAFLGTADRALREHRLSRAGRQALAVLDGAGGPLSPTTLADRLMVTPASVTSLLDTLERRGLVVRRPDPDDRRRLLVSVTSEGSAVVDRFLPEVVALQTAAMTGLSERQRRQLRDLLALVRAGLSEMDPEVVAHDAPHRGAHPAS